MGGSTVHLKKKGSSKYIVADNLLYYCTYVDMYLHWGSWLCLQWSGFSRLS